MLTVYCEKMSQSGLSSTLIGLLGVALGAFLGFISSYFTQRWQHKNTLELEQKKSISKLYSDFALGDLFKYIDMEIDYIQQLYYKAITGKPTNNKVDGGHVENLIKHRAMIRMFKDENLNQSFEKLIDIRTCFFKEKFKDKGGYIVSDPAITLNNAMNLSSEIKVLILKHCSFKSEH